MRFSLRIAVEFMFLLSVYSKIEGDYVHLPYVYELNSYFCGA